MDAQTLKHCFGDVSKHDTSEPNPAITQQVVKDKLPAIPRPSASETRKMTEERLGPTAVDFAHFGSGSWCAETRQLCAFQSTRDTFPSVRSNTAVCQGKWMFEVTIINTGSCLQLGWATPGCRFRGSDGVGDSRDSYAIDGTRMRKWNVGSRIYPEWWRDGDVIGCCIDLDQGTISYRLNGEDRGVAFDKVRVGHRLAYCAAVSIGYTSAVFVNVGQAPFHYPVEGYRPLQNPPTPAIARARTVFDMLLKLEEVPRLFEKKLTPDAEVDVLMSRSTLVDHIAPLLANEYVVRETVVPTLLQWIRDNQEERVPEFLDSIVEVLADEHVKSLLVALMLSAASQAVHSLTCAECTDYVKLARLVLTSKRLYQEHVQRFNEDTDYCCLTLALFVSRQLSRFDFDRDQQGIDPLMEMAKGNDVAVVRAKEYDAEFAALDRERGALLTVGMDRLGAAPRVTQWGSGSIFVQLISLLDQAANPEFTSLWPIVLPSSVVPNLFFALTAHMCEDEAFAAAGSDWLDLANVRGIVANSDGLRFGEERLGGAYDFVLRTYRRLVTKGKAPPVPDLDSDETTKDGPVVAPRSMLMVLGLYVFASMTDELDLLADGSLRLRDMARALQSMYSTLGTLPPIGLLPGQRSEDVGQRAERQDDEQAEEGEEEGEAVEKAGSEDEARQHQQERAGAGDKVGSSHEAEAQVFNPWQDEQDMDAFTVPFMWSIEVKMQLLQFARRFGHARQRKFMLFLHHTLHMLKGLEKDMAIGFLPLVVGKALKYMPAVLATLPNRLPHTHPTQRGALMACSNELGRGVVKQLLEVFTSWLVNGQLAYPKMRPHEWPSATVLTQPYDLMHMLCSDSALLKRFLHNCMQCIANQGQRAGRLILTLANLLGESGLGGGPMMYMRDTEHRNAEGFPAPELALAWREVCGENPKMAAKFLSAVIEKPNWTSSEMWQRLSEVKEAEEGGLPRQDQAPLKTQYQRIRLLYSTMGMCLQLLEFMAHHCPNVFDESVRADNGLHTWQVAEICLHLVDRLFLTDTFADIVGARFGLQDCDVGAVVLSCLNTTAMLASMSDKNLERVAKNSLLTEDVLTSLDDRLRAPTSPLHRKRVPTEARERVLRVVQRLKDRAAEKAKARGGGRGNGSTSEEDLCPICYASPVEVKFVPCGHTSCRLCISRHLQSNVDCFFCKAKVQKLEDLNGASQDTDEAAEEEEEEEEEKKKKKKEAPTEGDATTPKETDTA